MPKVENAIIMAAGLGTRMRPLTNKIPKPLVKVNGHRMIETIIQGLNKNGIKDITIVTGYLADKFNFLEDKYDGVSIIKNPYYQEYNNLSSLYVATFSELAVVLLLSCSLSVNKSQTLSADCNCSSTVSPCINF